MDQLDSTQVRETKHPIQMKRDYDHLLKPKMVTMVCENYACKKYSFEPYYLKNMQMQTIVGWKIKGNKLNN